MNFAAQFNGEMKRFQCLPSFVALQETLQSLFALTAPVKINYLDNENDLVVISSQTELDFAATLSPEVQLVLSQIQPEPLLKTEPKAVPLLKTEPLQDDVAVPSADNRLQKLQSRLVFVQNALSQPNLKEDKRQKLTVRKQKIETLIENRQTFSKGRVRRNPRTRNNDRLQEIDTALSKPNLPVKEIEKLNKKRSRIDAAKNGRIQAFKLMEIQTALDTPGLPAARSEKLQEKKKKKLEERMAQKNARVNRQDARRAEKLEDVKKVLEKEGLGEKRREKLKAKEVQLKSYFDRQDDQMAEAFGGVSFKLNK
jgi:hypothetical protein